MDDRTFAGAGTPEHSPLLQRRVGAGLVDLAIVGLVTAAAAAVTATRVPAIRRPDGSVTVSPVDRQLIDALPGPLSREQLIDDTLWALSTVDLAVVLASLVLAGLIIGVLTPMLTGGRSPGKALFRIRVVGLDGQTPGTTGHLIRTLVSPIDLMPLVVPGLTGYAFAASNPHSQRIGDRLANTVVVRQNGSDDLISVFERMNPPVSIAVRPPMRPAPTIRSATLLEFGPATASRSALNRRPEPPDPRGEQTARRFPTAARTTATKAGTRPGLPGRRSDGDTVFMNEQHRTAEQSGSVEAREATPIPVEERPTNPYPKPVRPSRDTGRGEAPARYGSLALPESSLSDMPLTNETLMEALGLSPSNRHPVTPAIVEDDITEYDVRHASQPAPNRRAPIWSDDWEAWIYWDTTLEHWFRHDAQHGTWLPMDDD